MEFLYAYYIAMVNILIFKRGLFFDTALCSEELIDSLEGVLDFGRIQG
jgi:hypothetical protein